MVIVIATTIIIGGFFGWKTISAYITESLNQDQLDEENADIVLDVEYYPDFTVTTIFEDTLIIVLYEQFEELDIITSNRKFIIMNDLSNMEVGHSYFSPIIYIKASNLSEDEIESLITELEGIDNVILVELSQEGRYSIPEYE